MIPQYKICNKCSGSGKWKPVSVYKLEDFLSRFLKKHEDIKSIKALRKNISYNLQHIEFQLEMQKEFETTDVLLGQNWKITIITTMSVIESLLHYLLVSKNLYKKTDWEEKPTTKIENDQNIDSTNYKIQNLIFKKGDERLVKMNLKQMVSVAQNNELLGTRSSVIYKNLNYLRKLRNRIHLHISTSDTDTDYMKITKNGLDTSKKVLRSFMLSSLFSPTLDQKRLFDYLK